MRMVPILPGQLHYAAAAIISPLHSRDFNPAIHQDYEFIENIGEGAYGAVWKCRHRTTGHVVAVKGFKRVRARG